MTAKYGVEIEPKVRILRWKCAAFHALTLIFGTLIAGTIHCLALYITGDKRGIIVANSAPYRWGVRGDYFTILLAQYTATSAFLGRISVR